MVGTRLEHVYTWRSSTRWKTQALDVLVGPNKAHSGNTNGAATTVEMYVTSCPLDGQAKKYGSQKEKMYG